MKTRVPVVCLMFVVLCFTSVSLAQDTSCIGLYCVADTLYKQGKWSAATQVGKQALKKSQLSGVPYDLNTIKTLELLGKIKKDQGKLGDARIFCSKAQKASTVFFGTGHPNAIKTLIGLADLAERRSDEKLAKALYSRALDASHEAGRGDDISVAPALVGLAGIYRNEGQMRGAEQLYKRALETYETLYKYRPYLASNIARIYNDLGSICFDRKDYGQASSDYRKALAKYGHLGGFNSIEAADTRVSLGDTYRNWNKPARAERQYRKALAIYQNLGGSHDIKTAITLKRLGDVYFGKGNYPKAERTYTTSVAVLKKCTPTCKTTLASAMKALADLQMRRGDHAKAVPLYKSVLAILK
jgi:tetratricopeptide (TPR) repeat protein